MSGPAGLRKRSINIAGHATSISLEGPFWDALGEIAAARGTSVRALVAAIDTGRGTANLSSAIRVFVLQSVKGAEVVRDDLEPGERSSEKNALP